MGVVVAVGVGAAAAAAAGTVAEIAGFGAAIGAVGVATGAAGTVAVRGFATLGGVVAGAAAGSFTAAAGAVGAAEAGWAGFEPKIPSRDFFCGAFFVSVGAGVVGAAGVTVLGKFVSAPLVGLPGAGAVVTGLVTGLVTGGTGAAFCAKTTLLVDKTMARPRPSDNLLAMRVLPYLGKLLRRVFIVCSIMVWPLSYGCCLYNERNLRYFSLFNFALTVLF